MHITCGVILTSTYLANRRSLLCNQTHSHQNISHYQCYISLPDTCCYICPDKCCYTSHLYTHVNRHWCSCHKVQLLHHYHPQSHSARCICHRRSCHGNQVGRINSDHQLFHSPDNSAHSLCYRKVHIYFLYSFHKCRLVDDKRVHRLT